MSYMPEQSVSVETTIVDAEEIIEEEIPSDVD
jgi:hypothetical protein